MLIPTAWRSPPARRLRVKNNRSGYRCAALREIEAFENDVREGCTGRGTTGRVMRQKIELHTTRAGLMAVLFTLKSVPQWLSIMVLNCDCVVLVSSAGLSILEIWSTMKR
ncbi:hypothetical protein EVAR_5722_1 [Eumeta japonica]|uniref:Uncharacterized protein n=1 Tax=Eumeta variegata TaxID=151549 RepID=A0A4C1T7E8_EUMVA|nr:hypothetical protein EVAR_5722_1 [Eumeta japonica]